MKTIIIGLILSCSLLINANVFAGYLFQWNSGSGTTMPGWTWSDDVAYGNPGWTLNADGPLGGGETFMWGYGPRLMEKSGYDNNNLALIDTSVRAPSTSQGGALKIYEVSGTHLCSWWMWYDGKPLKDRGVANNTTNRWSFYIKLEGINGITKDGGATSIGTNDFHVGTYLCWNDGDPVYGQGDGCPYEGPGNQHWYHYLTFDKDGWIHVELDEHPQHRRDSYVVSNDPVLATDGKHYLEQLNQFYMEIRYAQTLETRYWVDEMNFYSTQDTPEPNQNDISITSVWVGYFPGTDKWQISWQDMGYLVSSLGNTTQSTYEVRWSTSPITNENYSSATLITPEFYGGTIYTGSANLIRKVDSWTTIVWTQFVLADEVELNNNKVYFAIKDVSVLGAHAGSQYPWNITDGRDASSSLIRTIDFDIRPSQINGSTSSTNGSIH